MVQYSKIAVILLNTTNRINTQETDVISLHFALRVILNIKKSEFDFHIENSVICEFYNPIAFKKMKKK